MKGLFLFIVEVQLVYRKLRARIKRREDIMKKV